MSRTSTALRRLGVAGLAAVTIGAGVPALVSTAAQAATGPVTRVVLTPENTTAPSGTCVEYTAQAQNAGNQGVATATITVALSEGPNATATGVSATFCNPETGAAVDTTNNSAGQRTAVFETNANGFVVFGVVDNAFDAGTGAAAAANNLVVVTAFYDTNNDRVRNGTEPFDQSTQSTTRPSTQNDVDTVNAEPEGATNVVGEPHVIRVTTTNDSGTATAGIVVSFTVTGVNAQSTRNCDGPTNSVGQTTCTYTGTNVGNDTIRVFVNQTGAGFASTNEFNAAPGGASGTGEPFDDVNKTYVAAQGGRAIDVTCLGETGDNATNSEESAGACTNVIPDTNRTFRAVVTQSNTGSNVSTTGTLVRFTVSGGSGDETITIVSGNGTQTSGGGAGDCTTVDNTGTTGTATDSFCDVVVNDPTPRVGEVLTVTGTVRGTSPAVTDSATLTFRNQPTDARFITVTPDGGETISEGARTFTARVTDADGNPVQGVTVRFTSTGTGFLRGDTFPETNANGEATVVGSSARNETGTMTVTGTIVTPNSQCNQARGAGTDPEGGNTGTTTAAGNCSDTGSTTFVTSFSSPTGAPTGQPTGQPSGQPSTPPGCATAANQNPNIQIRVNTPTINATGLASVTATGAQPGQVIELQGYSQNHFGTRNFNNDPTPVDRTAVADSNGSATFNNLRPASNTRVRARQRGCAFGNIGAVINVRTQITLQVVRNGVRTYTFSGRTIPAREGGLIVTLYRVVGQTCAAGVEPRNCPGEVLFRQTRATAGTDVQPQPVGAGLYSVRVTFPRSDANTRRAFVVKTGQDAQNAPGRSNVRFLSIF